MREPIARSDNQASSPAAKDAARAGISPGAVKIALAALIWGSMGILIRLIALSPVVIVFWRNVFAGAALLAIVVAAGRFRELFIRKYRVLLPLTGVFLVVSMIFMVKAVQLTSIANAVLTVYTAPVIIALLAPLFLGEPFMRRTLLALVLAIGGLGLMLAPQGLSIGGRDTAGIALAGVCAIAYAMLVLVGKKIVADIGAQVMAFYDAMVAIVILVPFAVRLPLPPTMAAWTMLAALGIVHTAAAGILYLSGLRQVTAQEAGILAYLEPLSAGVYAMIFLGEPLTLWVVGGGLLIVAAGWTVIQAQLPVAAPVHE